ncbi:MAG: Crp/Fnr family transcriptional regulator [Eubacteriaceae bacterium]|jgi:CRP-like cAMP-binding protein|nr:Crp/Fnr family transcriptional regulator [Eubacteriaceae bacterium]
MMNIREAFAEAEILKGASPSVLADLASCASLRRVKGGSHLFLDKEEVTTLYVMAEGMAALYKYADNGEKRVIFVYGRGQSLNEDMLSGLPASVSCEVIEDGMVLCFPFCRVTAAMKNDYGFCSSVMDSMSLKIRRLYRQMKNASNLLRGDKKIAAKLWKLSRDFGIPAADCADGGNTGGTVIDMNLTITYLADMLGSKRETVSRQLKVLTDLGLVDYSNGKFIIPDRDALQKYFKTP